MSKDQALLNGIVDLINERDKYRDALAHIDGFFRAGWPDFDDQKEIREVVNGALAPRWVRTAEVVAQGDGRCNTESGERINCVLGGIGCNVDHLTAGPVDVVPSTLGT